MGSEPGGGSASSRTWNRQVLVALLLLAILFWWILAPNPWGWLAPGRVTVAVDDSEYQVPPRKWRQVLALSLSVMTEAERAGLLELESKIDEEVVKAFALPRQHVTTAADWYYSLGGQGVRIYLGARELLPGDTGASSLLTRELNSRLFPEKEWGELTESTLGTLIDTMQEVSQRSLDRMRETLHRELAPYRVESSVESPDIRLDLDWNANSMLATMVADDTLFERSFVGLPASAVATWAARRGAQVAATRLASRSLAGKAAAACLGTGPLAKLCVLGFFAGTVVVTEAAILYLDEARNRDDFEVALHADIARVEDRFKEALIHNLLGGLQAEFEARGQIIDAQIRPVDQMFSG